MKKESLEKIEKREKEPMPSMRILLVEDKLEYQEVAKKALESLDPERKVVLELAKDFEEFENFIKENEEKKEKFDCVITDLLFPRKAGSGDRSLGIKVIEEIKKTLESPKVLESPLSEVREFESATEYLEEIEKAVKGESHKIEMYDRPLGEEAKREGKLIEEKRDFKIQPTEADQPLGVLVVKKAKKMNLPYIVVTSGHGAHGDITTPIAFYLKIKHLLPDIRGNQGFQILKEGKMLTENPFCTDIDKRNKEIWSHIFQGAGFYVEEARRREKEK